MKVHFKECMNPELFLFGLFLPCVLQCCDLGYHASLQRALRTYLSAEQNVETSKHSGLETLEGATESLEANGDKQKLMETYNNVFCPPARFDFQSHMGDTVCF